MQRYGRLTVLSALLFTLVAVFGTVNAFANAAPHTRIGSKSQTTGVSVYYFGQPGFHRLVVCDTKADSDSPYAWWNSGTSHHQPTNRAEAHVGNGNCQHFPVVDNGTGLISYQACRDIPRHFDNCGKWVTTIF